MGLPCRQALFGGSYVLCMPQNKDPMAPSHGGRANSHVQICISPPTHCPQSAYLLTERETHFLIAWQPFSNGLRVDSLVLVSLNVLCTCCMTLHDAINLPEF